MEKKKFTEKEVEDWCRLNGYYSGDFWFPNREKSELWEILVPASSNKHMNFSYGHHKEWDEFVKNISGGITIMKTAKGEWVSPDGELYIDRVIPCRIICNEEEINQIVDFTIDHYKQEAVVAYRLSTRVVLKYDEKKVPVGEKKVPFERPSDFPQRPMSRIIAEGMGGSCPKCGSSEKRSWFGLGKKIGCIQPECENYYMKKKS